MGRKIRKGGFAVDKNPTVFGYVVAPYGNRGSITEQMRMLEEYAPDSVLTDREYKSKTERISIEHILQMLKHGDVLVTTRLSNLGRTYGEIFGNWKAVTEKGAFIVTLEHPRVDTRPGKQEPSHTAAEFLTCLVEMEEERSRRVTEGMAAAKLKGIRPGIKRMKLPKEFSKYKEDWGNKKISAREAGRLLGITHTTFLRWVRES